LARMRRSTGGPGGSQRPCVGLLLRGSGRRASRSRMRRESHVRCCGRLGGGQAHPIGCRPSLGLGAFMEDPARAAGQFGAAITCRRHGECWSIRDDRARVRRESLADCPPDRPGSDRCLIEQSRGSEVRVGGLGHRLAQGRPRGHGGSRATTSSVCNCGPRPSRGGFGRVGRNDDEGRVGSSSSRLA